MSKKRLYKAIRKEGLIYLYPPVREECKPTAFFRGYMFSGLEIYKRKTDARWHGAGIITGRIVDIFDSVCYR